MSELKGATVFITADPASPAPGWIAGGLTLVERRVREAARGGAARIVLACEGAVPEGIAVERVAPGTAAPPGAVIRRADELAGVAIVDQKSLRKAEWTHMQGMMKSFQGMTDAWVNHHVSLRITRLLARTRLHPNHITVFTIFVGIASALLVAFGSRIATIVGALLIQFHNILDSCDGELARLRFQFSKKGAWLDNVSDDIADAGYLAGLSWAVGGPWGWFGLGVVIARVYMQADMYRHVLTRHGGEFNRFRWWFEADRATIDDVYAKGSWTTFVRNLTRRDTYALIWCVLTILGLPQVVLCYGAAIFGGQAVLMLLHSVQVARGKVRIT